MVIVKPSPPGSGFFYTQKSFYLSLNGFGDPGAISCNGRSGTSAAICFFGFSSDRKLPLIPNSRNLSGFSDIEIASFDNEQIRTFVGNWFSQPRDIEAGTAVHFGNLLFDSIHSANHHPDRISQRPFTNLKHFYLCYICAHIIGSFISINNLVQLLQSAIS